MFSLVALGVRGGGRKCTAHVPSRPLAPSCVLAVPPRAPGVDQVPHCPSPRAPPPVLGPAEAVMSGEPRPTVRPAKAQPRFWRTFRTSPSLGNRLATGAGLPVAEEAACPARWFGTQARRTGPRPSPAGPCPPGARVGGGEGRRLPRGAVGGFCEPAPATCGRPPWHTVGAR